MLPSTIKILNRKLANPTAIKFIKYLQKNHPTARATITFQEHPVIALQIAGTQITCNINGTCAGTDIKVSTFQEDTKGILRLIAHEYRHAMQTNEGLYPDTNAAMFSLAGQSVKFNGPAERDAIEFSDRIVTEFTCKILTD